MQLSTIALLIVAPFASSSRLLGKHDITVDKSGEQACEASDLKHRAALQNKLAGLCEEMCKEVGAYPNCSGCAGFIPPDSTPGVMTWDELLEHMDNLVDWGQ